MLRLKFVVEVVVVDLGFTMLLTSQVVHRCGPGGSMHACHAAGPGSIPSRDKFPG